MSTTRLRENQPEVNDRGRPLTAAEVSAATGIDRERLRELVPARKRGLGEVVYLAAHPSGWLVSGMGR